MTDAAKSSAREISLGDDFGDVAVKVNGVRVEVRTDGSVLAYTKGGVDAYTNAPVRVHPAANDDVKLKAAPEIGDDMEDGTIYAGISPETHKPMYATSDDAPGFYAFDEAPKYANNLDAHGHNDFRVPTKNELDVLYENRHKGKLKGTFNETGSDPFGWYCSSSPYEGRVMGPGWVQRFSDGLSPGICLRSSLASLRCVR
jgi:hypothetical protein